MDSHHLLGASISFFLFVAALVVLFIRQPLSSNRHRYKMITWDVYKKCRQSRTVTSELAKDPSQCPLKLFKSLYDSHHDVCHPDKNDSRESVAEEISRFEQKDELQKARECGNWGSTEPSKLFLQVSFE